MIIIKNLTLYLFISTILLCSFSSNAINVKVKLENNQGIPVGNIVVYLTPTDPAVPLPNKKESIDINQQNKAFYPYINVMQQNNNIHFNNKDDITHQIYSPIGDNKFAFKIRAGESYTQTNLTALGEVTMGCNIHDWMSGYLLVVDTPYYNITNETGIINFEITHPGEYDIVLWHPLFNSIEHKVSHKKNINNDMEVLLIVDNENITLPVQEPTGSFDFLSEY